MPPERNDSLLPAIGKASRKEREQTHYKLDQLLCHIRILIPGIMSLLTGGYGKLFVCEYQRDFVQCRLELVFDIVQKYTVHGRSVRK
jgi:hypothetical protein